MTQKIMIQKPKWNLLTDSHCSIAIGWNIYLVITLIVPHPIVKIATKILNMTVSTFGAVLVLGSLEHIKLFR